MSTTVEGPVSWEGLVLRLAKLPDGSGRMEVWSGSAWEPSRHAGVDKMVEAAPLSPAEAAALGIPASDLATPRA